MPIPDILFDFNIKNERILVEIDQKIDFLKTIYVLFAGPDMAKFYDNVIFGLLALGDLVRFVWLLGRGCLSLISCSTLI